MDLARWQEENGQYLAASITWLRLRLEQLARSEEEPPTEQELRLREAAEARDRAARMDPPPALLLLSEQLRLTTFELNLLLLCVAVELDTRIPELCARAVGNSARPHPTFALAFSLFDSPAWDSLSPQRPLRFLHLIELNQAPAQPLTCAPLRADERVVNYVKGLNYLEPRLAQLLTPVEAARGPLPPSQQSKVDAIVDHWSRVNPEESPPATVLLGVDPTARLLVAQAASARLRRALLRIGIDSLPSHVSESENLARLWQREAALLPLALYIDAQTDGASPDALVALNRFVTRAIQSTNCFLFIGTREPLARADFHSQAVDVARPSAEEQLAEWRAALESLPEPERRAAAGRLSGQFSLNCSDIRQAVAETRVEPIEAFPERLWDYCRDRARPRLANLAQRIDVRATWDDLVVTPDTERLLRDITAQVACRDMVYGEWQFGRRMNRGLGITALFSGDSGTGKTMAAEVIANELRLALYRIDLSQVVSKFIGETEKNLQRVFDLMEGGGAILFFDEADALFGKRSEVRDSHDRYANIEVNYLLQRMESYTGLAILATNMKSALDPAFLRRLRFIVPFSFPGPAERRVLWQKAFPKAMPTQALDYERLSRLNLTGASIHNVALNAAFMAARSSSPVTMPMILMAARTEYRKMDRPVSESEFRD